MIRKTQLVRVPVRLGADVFDSGAISDHKRDRLIKSLRAFRLLVDVYGVNYLRCCATSAMREATNRSAIIARVEMETGLHVEVIPGSMEADLIVNTFWTQDLLKDRSYLYIDVGGGSTELTWLEEGKRKRSASFPVGTVRMLADKVGEDTWKEMMEFLYEIHGGRHRLMGIGTGGNINRIFKENGNAFGEPLLISDIRKQRDRIASFSFEERVRTLRLRPDRADVIVPAADIFLRVMGMAGIDEIFVPKVGLADGVVYDLYMKQRGKVRYPVTEPVG
ncbi:MAG: exopolyphosphatase [Flavobacteriales bacterium]|nr:exopolyphosphatase [Flavobacteriales bacterium]